MVKGISKQVIVVQSPDTKLFEQAIFILKEDALKDGVTDEQLLREAKLAVREERKMLDKTHGFVWALAGASMTALIWMASSLF